jgi:hypothetical protein
VTPEQLYVAVAKTLEADAFASEQARQTQRVFTKNERIAFRLGFYHGLSADVHRSPAEAWDRAAQMLSDNAK